MFKMSLPSPQYDTRHRNDEVHRWGRNVFADTLRAATGMSIITFILLGASCSTTGR